MSLDRSGRYEAVLSQSCQRLLLRLHHVGLSYPSLMRPEATVSLYYLATVYLTLELYTIHHTPFGAAMRRLASR